MGKRQLVVNGEIIDSEAYEKYHFYRIAMTLKKIREIGAKKVLEIGSHPWVMTAHLIDDPKLELCATISAEELVKWPDDIGVTSREYYIHTPNGNEARFTNYSVNIERTLFSIQEKPDTVLACEIIEHLIRAPHIMLININNWLPINGKLIVTTPNGAQFYNPLRRKSPYPAYRSNIYERHSYLYTLDELTDLIKLCGFKVIEAGYWDVYKRQGISRLYTFLSYLPFKYFKDKFKKTIYLVAKKEKNIKKLHRHPTIYDSRENWEYIEMRDNS